MLDKIIARDEWSDIPAVLSVLSVLKDRPIVASSSYRPQIEMIAEMQPDIVIADTMLQNDARKKLRIFGIPAIAESTSDADNLFNVIRNLALILDKQERGEEIIQYIEDYRNLIFDRVEHLDNQQKTKIFWEWRSKYKSGSSQ